MSETDEPFEVLGPWRGAFDIGTAAVVLGRTSGIGVQELSADEFFRELVNTEDWFGGEEREMASRYKELQSFFALMLSQAKVFRAGRPQVEILMVGRAADGMWVGVRTRAVET